MKLGNVILCLGIFSIGSVLNLNRHIPWLRLLPGLSIYILLLLPRYTPLLLFTTLAYLSAFSSLPRLRYIHPSPPTPGTALLLLLHPVYTSFSTYPKYTPPSQPTPCLPSISSYSGIPFFLLLLSPVYPLSTPTPVCLLHT